MFLLPTLTRGEGRGGQGEGRGDSNNCNKNNSSSEQVQDQFNKKSTILLLFTGWITACSHSQHILCTVEELLPVGLAGMFHVVE